MRSSHLDSHHHPLGDHSYTGSSLDRYGIYWPTTELWDQLIAQGLKSRGMLIFEWLIVSYVVVITAWAHFFAFKWICLYLLSLMAPKEADSWDLDEVDPDEMPLKTFWRRVQERRDKKRERKREDREYKKAVKEWKKKRRLTSTTSFFEGPGAGGDTLTRTSTRRYSF
ncbi:hypothetical protein BZA77DRAFT_326030 [Pyronema omphalodes]|nr:hypothetical protein BZA77DRAFT_326030 [Pyronema omphalodes]